MSRRSMRQAGRSRRASAQSTRSILRCACEPLEMRRLLTSVLYLDFGDNFPVGGLTINQGTLRGGFGGGGLQGPDLRQPDNAMTAGVNEAITDADNFVFTGTQQFVTFDYNNDGATNATDYTDLRANVLTLAQRYYAPFDLNVQIAPAVGDLGTSADYINDLRATLQLGANSNGEYDGWVFIGQVLRASDNAFISNLTNLNGISNGTDIDNENTQDNTGITFADAIFGGANNATIDTRLAYTAAHEAGHDFGLRHTNNGNNTSGNAQTDADMALQTGSNLVTGSAGAVNRVNFDFVTRFPLVRGDNNTIQNGNTFDITDTRIPYDRLANPNNLGLRAGAPAYVTGTGAFDEITITPGAPGFANVAVESHRDNSFANQIGATYSYAIPLGNGVLVEAGDSADRIIIDGTIAANFTVRGMNGNDQLIVDGNNIASGTYTPGGTTPALLDNNTSFLANLNLSGGANISIEEFETAGSITLQEIQNLTYVTPNSVDNLTLNTPAAAGSLQVTGTSDGIGLIPMIFNNVGSFTLDTGLNDSGSADDQVTISASGPSSGLNSLAVNTGAGGDLLDVNFATGNAIPAGGLSYNAGAAADPDDLLNLRGGSFATEVYTPFGPHSGSIVLDGSTTITYSNLAPINDTVVVADVTFNGTGAADTINLIDSGTFNGFDTTQINSPSFELVNFANKATVRVAGQNGGDTVNVSLTDPADGLNALFLYGEDQTGSGDDNAADTFNVIPNSGALPISVSGNGGTGDILNVDGNGGDFDVTNTTITAAGVQPITYGTVERLELGDGIFEVVGNVATLIHVNNAATLVGTGAAAGGITANNGGVVSPGIAGPGVLGSGNLAFNAGSNYTLDLNGTGPGLHDELSVTGTVNLSNLATISATVGFASIPGDEIVIIRNDGVDAVNGVFAGGNLLDFGAGGKWTIDYGYDADGDLAFNDVALIRYGAQTAPDPCDPTKTALFVSATSGADTIDFVKNRGNTGATVFINGVDEGTFLFDGHVYVMGQNGDDVINTAGLPAREVFIYGNTGNDQLTAGSYESILIGGFGNDVLNGANARDILIGGAGADLLNAGNATDILITGATTYDAVNAANRMALCEIADLWKNGSKPASLAGLLNAATLIADADVDTALGGHGKDYLILGIGDIDDRESQETILTI